MIRNLALLYLGLLATGSSAAITPWTDVTDEAGLGQNAVARLKFADLNSDGLPDIVLMPTSPTALPPVVLLQETPSTEAAPPHFQPEKDTRLPAVTRGDVLVFADLDNDGHLDAIVGRNLDIYQDDYQPPSSAPTRSAWLKGMGDSTFSEPVTLEAATMATTCALAIGDVNMDGLPDIFIGNWYKRYAGGFEGFTNDLLLQFRNAAQGPDFIRWPMPDENRITDTETDLGGRPTYGAALPRLDDGLPMLLELNYGRRWNRLYRLRHREPLLPPGSSREIPPSVLHDDRALPAHLIRELQGEDIAPAAHVDGDAIRHGRHPDWPRPHAESQPRSKRPDEAPFRANGNTFDAAVGDIDNDGDFDLFVSTIIHAWAGESSDRSRFLVNQLKETGRLDFLYFESLSVDRIPALPEPGTPLEPFHTNYNQGDIYAELADLNNDGRLDLILCSSDYPDPPPHDERLRIYFQQADGRFLDVTQALGIDHVGAGMPSLADYDRDGDLDLLVGQSFNRLPAGQRRQAAITSGALPMDAPADAIPSIRARLFRNESPSENHSLMLDLVGSPEMGTTRAAYGAIVRVAADLDGDPATPDVVQSRQVMGPHGHSGKQHALTVHFGLGLAEAATSVEIDWPGASEQPSCFESLPAGRYQVEQAGAVLIPSR